jgi:hypothetical protein
MHILKEASSVESYALEMSRFINVIMELELGDSYFSLRQAGAHLSLTPSAQSRLYELRRVLLDHADGRPRDVDDEQLTLHECLFELFTGGIPERSFHAGLTLYFGLFSITRGGGWQDAKQLTKPLAAFEYIIRSTMITQILRLYHNAEGLVLTHL